MIVTRSVEARYRGFLASAMLEVAPGVYLSPDLSTGVRDRIWSILEKWYAHLGNGAIALIFPDASATGGIRLRHLGEPPKEIWDADGVWLVRHAVPGNEPGAGTDDLQF